MSLAFARREALRGAALGAAGLALGGLARPGVAWAQDATVEDLRDFLAEAIALEQIGVRAYATASQAQGVDARLRATLERLRDQEQAHANAFRTAIDTLGYDAPDAPDDPDDSGVFDAVDGISDERAAELAKSLARVGEPKRAEDFLELLVELELDQIAFYVARAPELESDDLMTTSAEIVANQAQHLVVLEDSRGDEPVKVLDALDEATAAAAS